MEGVLSISGYPESHNYKSVDCQKHAIAVGLGAVALPTALSYTEKPEFFNAGNAKKCRRNTNMHPPVSILNNQTSAVTCPAFGVQAFTAAIVFKHILLMKLYPSTEAFASAKHHAE